MAVKIEKSIFGMNYGVEVGGKFEGVLDWLPDRFVLLGRFQEGEFSREDAEILRDALTLALVDYDSREVLK